MTASRVFAATLLVSNEKDNTVTVLDSNTLKTIKTIPVSRRPRGIIMNPNPRRSMSPPAIVMSSM
jgi:YVTN family beta-propeller protein